MPKLLSSKLFYDGQCSLCSREIKLLSRLKSTELELVDIHLANLDQYAFNNETARDVKLRMLAHLHLQTASGHWKTGLDATVTAWCHTPIGFVLLPLRWPLIRPLADRIYERWARKRACSLGYT